MSPFAVGEGVDDVDGGWAADAEDSDSAAARWGGQGADCVGRNKVHVEIIPGTIGGQLVLCI